MSGNLRRLWIKAYEVLSRVFPVVPKRRIFPCYTSRVVKSEIEKSIECETFCADKGRYRPAMKVTKLNRIFPPSRILLGFALAAAFMSFGAQAARTDEDTLKVVQTSKYNPIVGNWDVRQKGEPAEISKDFKNHLPNIEYHLVEEKTNGRGRITLTFRGDGDQRAIVKLKQYGEETNVRIRVGIVGSEAKSSQLFSYVYKNS